MVSDVFKQLRMATKRTVPELKERYIAFNDCLLDAETFTTLPFAPERVAVFHSDCDWSKAQVAGCPQFHKFLDTSIVKTDGKTPDPDLQKEVQEMFGYILLPTLEAHKAFFLVGDGANGKSVMCKILQKIVGQQFTTSMTIETLTTRTFAVAGLVGKRLNICNEDESRFAASDKFKAMIAGDMVAAERKYGDSFQFEPKAKFVFASNKLPTFEGMNYGLIRRLKMIPFNRRFSPGEQVKRLVDTIYPELPGIVAWAIEGAKRLVHNNFVFTDSDQSIHALRKFEQEVSSALYYIREKWSLDPTKLNFISSESLYNKYTDWCRNNGRKPMKSNFFYRDIASDIGESTFGIEIGKGRARGHFLVPAVVPGGTEQDLPQF
jgi:putative DNA primase/helicase